MSSPREIAEKIIDNLEDRSGFDWWWDDIDSETKKEIINDISQIVLDGMGPA